MKSLEITNNVILLGGGLEVVGEGEQHLQLASWSIERTDRIGEYYRANAAAFAGSSAMILCTGNSSAIYDKLGHVSKYSSEGTLSADRLMKVWDVPAKIIETETNADTGTLAIVNSIEEGLLRANAYNADNPLGVGAHRRYYKRLLSDFRDAGFALDATVNIHPRHADSAVREFISRGIRAYYFRGVHTGDLAEMRRRSDRITKHFGRS